MGHFFRPLLLRTCSRKSENCSAFLNTPSTCALCTTVMNLLVDVQFKQAEMRQELTDGAPGKGRKLTHQQSPRWSAVRQRQSLWPCCREMLLSRRCELSGSVRSEKAAVTLASTLWRRGGPLSTLRKMPPRLVWRCPLDKRYMSCSRASGAGLGSQVEAGTRPEEESDPTRELRLPSKCAVGGKLNTIGLVYTKR